MFIGVILTRKLSETKDITILTASSASFERKPNCAFREPKAPFESRLEISGCTLSHFLTDVFRTPIMRCLFFFITAFMCSAIPSCINFFISLSDSNSLRPMKPFWLGIRLSPKSTQNTFFVLTP